MIIAWLFIAVTIMICSVAWLRGGATERWGAAIVVLGTLGTWLTDYLTPFDWHGIQSRLLLIDAGVLIAFGYVASRTDRFWPLWATAFQLLAVLSQFGPLFSRAGSALAFALSEQLWGWMVLVALLFGCRTARPG